MKAVDKVSFTVRDGEVLGLAGESGCGKSTLVNSLILLKPPMFHAGGNAVFEGIDLMTADSKQMREIRFTKISIIPQYAMDALSPTKRLREIIRDLAKAHGMTDTGEVLERAKERLKLVNLSPKVLNMYPVEMSGGMRQRAVMVISTLMDPKLLLADEITSALDVSTQRVIIEMLKNFMARGLMRSMIFVTHDLATMYQIADRIAVMYAGKLVEIGKADDVIKDPAHPYTQALIKSLPKFGIRAREVRLKGIQGQPPDLLNPPKGCRFATRCPFATDHCRVEEPQLVSVGPGHTAACWLLAKR
jgi:peptide/nickel transport system ATP-binding protein